MHFAAATAAVVLQLLGKIAGFAQVQLAGMDVLVMSIERTNDYKFDPNWKQAFARCLNKTFLFGNDEKDSRFASACSLEIFALNPGDPSIYFSLWTRNPMTINLFDKCLRTIHNPPDFNVIERYLEKFKSDFFMGHRNSSSVVTFVLADKNIKNDIDSAKWFVEWPNRLFLVFERGYAGKEADLAKNGIAANHLLNFTNDTCPEFSKYLQHLLCHDEAVPPTPFACMETSPGSENCTEGKRYKVSKLLQAEIICAKILVEEETPCNCPNSTTVVSTMLPELSLSSHMATTASSHMATTVSSHMATAAKEEGIPVAMILGIIFTIIAVIAIVAVALYFFVFRGKRAQHGHGDTVNGAPDQSKSVQASMAGQSMGGAKSQTSLSKDRPDSAKIAKAAGSKVAQSPSSKNDSGSKKSHRLLSSKGNQSMSNVSVSKIKTSPSKVPSNKMESSSKEVQSSLSEK